MSTRQVGAGAASWRGHGDPVQARHLDVEQRHVDGVCAYRVEHLVAAADLGDDGQVALQFEQRGHRAADQCLVVGEQQPDHGGRSTRPEAADWAVRPVPTDSRAPSASARRRRPPAPDRRRRRAGAPTPSSRTSTLYGVRRISQRGARLCRTRFVTASRMVQANSSRHRPWHLVGRGRQVGLARSAAARAARAAAISPGQRDAAHAERRGAHVGQRVAAEHLQVAQLRRGPARGRRRPAAGPARP